jgi:hypothetical protein
MGMHFHASDIESCLTAGREKVSQKRGLKNNRGPPACLEGKSPQPPFVKGGHQQKLPPLVEGGLGGIFYDFGKQ